MTNEQWNLLKVWKEKRQGHVWVVQSDRGRNGYFKFANPAHSYDSGPLIANEWISAQLAVMLGFPVAQLQHTQVIGPDGKLQDGLVSIQVDAREIATWCKVEKKVRQRAEKYVSHVELLKMLVVFDVWIGNIDRASGKNLVLYRNDRNDRYEWYLIDHGHALFGAPKKWHSHQWNEPYWRRPWLFYHVPEGLLRLQVNLHNLEPMLTRVEQVSDETIDNVLGSVPKSHLNEEEHQFIRRWLITRRGQVRQMMRDWVNYRGVKEYNRK